ncbi:MAG: hypothetical protein ACE5HT_12915 [Gemmatimonadales bacterium]
MSGSLFSFAEALRTLLASGSAEGLEARWQDLNLENVGWRALAGARRREVPAWECALREVDGLLLRLLGRVSQLPGSSERANVRLRTFRLPALERLQHATAACLAGQRFGLAGLHTVSEDRSAPIARRYFAFLALAERHPLGDWPVFAQYLTPGAHHAFLGTAAEAARFYPEYGTVRALLKLFRQIQWDRHLRAFLSPRILQSLHFIVDASTLPFLRELLVVGYTSKNLEHCEVMRALVMVRRLTGSVESNAKFGDDELDSVAPLLDTAERVFDKSRDVLQAVSVI